MAIASISKEIRGFDVYNIVIFVFTSDQSTKTTDLSTRGFSNSHVVPQSGDILFIEEFSGIPATGGNLLSASLATLTGTSLLINNSSTRLVRITGL